MDFFYDLSHNLGLENAALFSDSAWLSYFIFLGCALSSRVFAFAKLVLSKSILQKKPLRMKDKLCFQNSFYILQRKSGTEGERYGSLEGQNY